jgi:hypothetical protein
MFYNNNKQFNLSKISSNNLGSVFVESYQNIAKFLKSEKDYLDLIPQNNLVERINENKNFNSFIKKIRYFSPY